MAPCFVTGLTPSACASKSGQRICARRERANGVVMGARCPAEGPRQARQRVCEADGTSAWVIALLRKAAGWAASIAIAGVLVAGPDALERRTIAPVAQAETVSVLRGGQVVQLDFGAPPEIKVPVYDHFIMPNGLSVYMIEDHEVPLVSAQIAFHAGDRVDPPGMRGLSKITASTMRLGGSTKLPGNKLNLALEDRAASIEASSESAMVTVSASCLAEDSNVMLREFFDLLRRPAFPQRDIDRVKVQLSGSIARRNDEPEGIAGRETVKMLFGDQSPYAASIENATVRAITRKDVIKFHSTYIAPNNAIFGIIGDFDAPEMRAFLTDLFADWAPQQEGVLVAAGARGAPAVDTTSAMSVRGVARVIDKPELSQAYVRMGMLGGRVSDPDYFALDVLNQILNGLGGRLFNEVRSKDGLAYSVSGQWAAGYDHDGVFIAGGETKGESAGAFVSRVLSVLRSLDSTSPPTQQEVDDAKEATLNSFVFNFQSPAQVLSRVMRYAFYGYPEDFALRYRDGVASVTPADVERAAKSRVREDDFGVVIVGNARTIRAALQRSVPELNIQPRSIDIAP